MSMAPIATLKRGDTLVIACAYTDDGSGSTSLGGMDVRAAAQDYQGRPLGPIAVRLVDVLGGLFELDVDSAAWPLGRVRFDVRYSWAGGATRATDTAYIDVVRAITEVAP